MSDDLILAVFPSRSALTKALKHLMELDDLEIKRAAVLTKATTGDLVYVGDDIGPEEGGLAGSTFGAALAALGLVQLGALALPGVGPIIAIGAGVLVGGLIGGATGRFAANLIDSGFQPAQVELLTERLQTGHVALVVEIRGAKHEIERLRGELIPYSAEVVERLLAAGTGA
jgi:uncharacterized membrane protein